MAFFQTLFSLAVSHKFFVDDICPDLIFVPIGRTAAIMKNAGLLLKDTSNGIAVCYQTERTQALRLYTSNSDQPMNLSFKLIARDNLFDNYTQLPELPENTMLYFSNDPVSKKNAGKFNLHQDDAVGAKDYRKMDAVEIASVLELKDRLLKPLAVVSIQVPEPPLTKSSAKQSDHLQYQINFMARKTIWKYYLLGKLSKTEAVIADLDAAEQFDCTGTETLGVNTSALSYRSRQTISLQQRSSCRFQLRDKPSKGGKVLIKRLPVASASQIYRENVVGKGAVVSEIYINY